MFKVAKWFIYLLVIAGIAFIFWFLPKYSFVQKNPGFCTNLTEHLYYCGTSADLKSMFNELPSK